MIEETFSKAMAEDGLVSYEPITADGKIHRFHVNGDKQGSKNGWYLLRTDGIPFGIFGSWKTGLKKEWCAKSKDDMTVGQYKDHQQQIIVARKALATENEIKNKAAREKAAAIWQNASLATDKHFYLVRKGVKSHGLRLSRGKLVIPLYDSNDVLHSLHFIDMDGNKRFLSGGRKKGCYFIIGELTETLCIAEGYATAASIYEATGYAIAIAFDAGNILSVAKVLREKFPAIKIIICADNDTGTPGNPGLTKAREAAAAVDAFITFPE